MDEMLEQPEGNVLYGDWGTIIKDQYALVIKAWMSLTGEMEHSWGRGPQYALADLIHEAKILKMYLAEAEGVDIHDLERIEAEVRGVLPRIPLARD